MKSSSYLAHQHQIALTEAKKVLGTTAKGLSDEAIMRLVTQVDVLTDIVVAHVHDSKNQSSIDISSGSLDTDG
jgi:hypothetical protein